MKPFTYRNNSDVFTVANKKELIADAWRTVFAEMDGDGDGYLRPSELSKSYFQFHQHENVSLYSIMYCLRRVVINISSLKQCEFWFYDTRL